MERNQYQWSFQWGWLRLLDIMALKVDRRHENTNEEVQLALQFQRLQANESHERPKGDEYMDF